MLKYQAIYVYKKNNNEITVKRDGVRKMREV